MTAFALALMLASGDVGPGPVISADWATCEDGRYADLRPDIPLLVVAESMNDQGWEPAFATGFVLYKDGLLIARRGFAMFEWRLSSREVADLWSRIGVDRLMELDADYDRRSERELRRTQRSCSLHTVAPMLTGVHVWKDGCQKTIAIPGVPLFVAATALGRPVLPDVSGELVGETRRALSTLPPPLVDALRNTMTQLPRHGRPWCRGAGCFAKAQTLRHHELWDASLDRSLIP